MNLKICAFLTEAGVDCNDPSASHLELLRYFEQTFDLDIMPMLEREWMEEQIDRDVKRGYFRELRKHVRADRLDAFDESVAALFG